MQTGHGHALPTLRFVHGDPFIDLETKLILPMNMCLMAALGAIGYGIHSASWLGLSQSSRKALLALFPPLFLIAPFMVFLRWGVLQSKLTHFFVAAQCTLTFFRWLELLCGSGPKGFDHNLLNFVIYFASPVEVAFDEAGKMTPAPAGLMKHLMLSFVPHALLLLAVQSVGRATGFSPFLGGIEVKPLSVSFWGWPWSLPALYLQVLWLYAILSLSMIICRAITTLCDIGTVQPMNGPLWFSTSVREFWGKRWNIIVHALMKRTYFTPLLRKGWPRCGGLTAFIMSGLFHEHSWALVNFTDHSHEYIPGLCMVFFGIQFVLCTVEAALARTTLGMWVGSLPGWSRTVAMTITLLPSSALFFAPIQDMMVEASGVGHTVELVWDGTQTFQFEWRYLPLDWGLMAMLGAIAMWKDRRSRRHAASILSATARDSNKDE